MNRNITVEEVYTQFRKAQADNKNRPYRLPKDFESFFKNRMSKPNRDNLVLATQFFNTKWVNVDPFLYFQCGFELYKTFTYSMFFKPNIINLYKQRDKMRKRDLNDVKRGILDSAKFVRGYMNQLNIPNLTAYCRIRVDSRSLICIHYLENKIDKFFVVLLIRHGYIVLNDDERMMMPYVVGNYRDMVEKIEETNGFIEKVKEKLNARI